MADETTKAPAASKAQPTKATMAPAARGPEGAPDATALQRLQRENDALQRELHEALTADEPSEGESELDRLRRENGVLQAAVAATRNVVRSKPRGPSFGMSEGERQELEAHGVTTSPWTGERIEGDGSPRTKA